MDRKRVMLVKLAEESNARCTRGGDITAHFVRGRESIARYARGRHYCSLRSPEDILLASLAAGEEKRERDDTYVTNNQIA